MTKQTTKWLMVLPGLLGCLGLTWMAFVHLKLRQRVAALEATVGTASPSSRVESPITPQGRPTIAEAPPAPAAPPAPPRLLPLDPGHFERVWKDELAAKAKKECWDDIESALESFEVVLRVDPSGAVQKATIASKLEGADREAAACVVERAYAVRYPAANDVREGAVVLSRP